MSKAVSPASWRRSVTIGGQTIAYELVKKRVKNLNLRVRPDGGVLVSIPFGVSDERADRFVSSKAAFIFAARRRYETSARILAGDAQYLPGEPFYYLGRPLSVQIRSLTSGREHAERQEDHLVLYLNPSSGEGSERARQRRGALAERWLREQGMAYFSALSDRVWPLFAPLGVPPAQIKVRRMKSTWGNCRPLSGVITINSKLLHVPAGCIEYVMVHEYAHFIHPNHSADFYRLVGAVLPDYQKRRQLLRQFG